MSPHMKTFLKLLLTFLLIPSLLLAAPVGRIAGTVKDTDQNPLVGASVQLKDTKMGNLTNEDGRFAIENIPAGTYTLFVTYAGFAAITKEKVEVLAGSTDYENFVMVTEAYLAEEMVVKGEQEGIQKEITSSRYRFSNKELSKMAQTSSVTDAVAVTPGVVGKGEEIHFRGGRSDEVMYIVDGIPIKDPLVGVGPSLDVPVAAVEEMQVFTGGFNAEYGQAQSGIVNITTREGDLEHFEHTVSLQSDHWFTNWQQMTDHVALSSSGPVIPGAVAYYALADGYMTDTWTPTHQIRAQREALGVKYTPRQDNRGSAMLHLKWAVDPVSFVEGTAKYSNNTYNLYNQLWRLLPDHSYDFNRTSAQGTLRLARYITSGLFWSATGGYYDTGLNYYPGLTPDKIAALEATDSAGMPRPDMPDGATITYDSLGRQIDNFAFTSGYDIRWHKHRMIINSGVTDLLIRLDEQNQMKLGGGYTADRIHMEDIEHTWYQNSADPAGGSYPTIGVYRDFYDVQASSGFAYIQNKLEWTDLLMNIGVRLDYFNPGPQVNAIKDFRSGQTYNIKSKVQVSPRLGISFPIVKDGRAFFSFGTFAQTPKYEYLYTGLNRPQFEGGINGNPDLGFEVTSAFEARYEHEVSKEVKLGGTFFYKSIKNLIVIREGAIHPLTYFIFTNDAYAKVTGFELTGIKYFSEYWTGQFSYTYLDAKGNISRPGQSYNALIAGITTPNNAREFRLDWDQRNTVNVSFTLQMKRDAKQPIRGLHLPDAWALNVAFQYSSGLPVPSADPYNPANDYYNLEYPSRSEVNLRLQKDFFLGATRLEVALDVKNLFNEDNPAQVDKLEGFGYRYNLYSTADVTSGTYISRVLGPAFWDSGIQAKLGVKWVF